MESRRRLFPFDYYFAGLFSKPRETNIVLRGPMEIFRSFTRLLSLFSTSEIAKPATRFPGTITSSRILLAVQYRVPLKNMT